MKAEYGAISESFGNITIRCRRDSFVVSIVRERLLWFIDVGSCGLPVNVPYWRVCLGGLPVRSISRNPNGSPPTYESNLAFFQDDSDWVMRHPAALDESSDSLTVNGCLREAIRQHNEQRFGRTSDAPHVMVPRDRGLEPPSI